MSVSFTGASGIRLASDVDGPWTGPPVLLLHGGGQTRYAWKGAGRVLAEHGFLSVALDLRGHGQSGWADDADYALTTMADDLRAVIEQVGRPAALVGASLGGLVAMVAAGEEPRVPVTAVVLVDIVPSLE